MDKEVYVLLQHNEHKIYTKEKKKKCDSHSQKELKEICT